MAGKIHQMIEKIVTTRSAGNPALAQNTRTKLLLQGIDATKWNATSPDDPAMVAKVQQAAQAFGVTL